jgi:hypothetical protein
MKQAYLKDFDPDRSEGGAATSKPNWRTPRDAAVRPAAQKLPINGGRPNDFAISEDRASH